MLFRNREGTHKNNANTSYVCGLLIKTVNANVVESNYNRKLSYEIANVMKGSGEGRFFL